MDLHAWLERENVSLLELANRAGVSWRTARSAKEGQLLSVSKALQIAESIGRRDGKWIVDPASMMPLAPTQPEAAE